MERQTKLQQFGFKNPIPEPELYFIRYYELVAITLPKHSYIINHTTT